MTPRKIFISYSHDDGDKFARDLCTRLTDVGHKPWRDHERLAKQGGIRWTQEITTQVLTADVVVVVLTPGACASHFVEAEWMKALEHRRPVVPVMFLDCGVPLPLMPYQYIDFRAQYKSGIAALLERLAMMDQPGGMIDGDRETLAALKLQLHSTDNANRKSELRGLIHQLESRFADDQVRRPLNPSEQLPGIVPHPDNSSDECSTESTSTLFTGEQSLDFGEPNSVVNRAKPRRRTAMQTRILVAAALLFIGVFCVLLVVMDFNTGTPQPVADGKKEIPVERTTTEVRDQIEIYALNVPHVLEHLLRQTPERMIWADWLESKLQADFGPLETAEILNLRSQREHSGLTGGPNYICLTSGPVSANVGDRIELSLTDVDTFVWATILQDDVATEYRRLTNVAIHAEIGKHVSMAGEIVDTGIYRIVIFAFPVSDESIRQLGFPSIRQQQEPLLEIQTSVVLETVTNRETP